ncbi:short-chain dehydrogenase, partial [Burkholderia pseudomallei]|nr:short-chain dehydrogenase [Burkholderia pseudomallei]
EAVMNGLEQAEGGIGNDARARVCDPQDVGNLVLFLASDE